MNIKELQKIMKDGHMSAYDYSINELEKNEAYHIINEDGKWHVFYKERGNKNSFGRFEKEEDAIMKFIDLVKDFL